MCRFKVVFLFIVIVILLFMPGCQNKSDDHYEEPMTRTNFQIHTVVTITLYDWRNEDTFDKVFAEIDRLGSLLSLDVAGSDLEKLAANAGKEWTAVSPETMKLLKESIRFSKLSDGLFDCTAGPLISLWNIKDGQGYYPGDDERQAAMGQIDYEKIQFGGDDKVMLSEQGMVVNLGAIAKGFIADNVKKLLVEEGVESAVINLGGNVLLIGEKPGGTPFGIGVQDPLGDTGAVLGALEVKNKSLVSSGINERNFVHEGKLYHHILNPFTGFPADNGVAGVTVVSDNSMIGDALSTTVVLLGEEKGMALIESMEGIECIIVNYEGKVRCSSGLEGKLITKESESND